MPPGGLVDESYAWDSPTFVPADATVTVAVGATVDLTVQNPIVRVTAPVRLVKTFTGAQGVVPADRTYPITWSCTYPNEPVRTGTVNLAADPGGIVVDPAVPLTSSCTATEPDLGTPSA